jgi:hypothetical protein
MTALTQRKTRLTFETADTLFECGAHRMVVVEAEPEFATLRLKGLQHRVSITWGALYHYAARIEADRARTIKKGRL